MMKTYSFIAAMLFCLMPYMVQAQVTDINSRDLRGKVVYQDDEVVFRQLDEHTWIGNGHRLYNESLYLIEGNERAILIDAGVYIPDLDKIVAKITSKPVTMMLTHAHGDHVGGVGPFPEVYLNAGDMTIVPNNMRNYKGQIRYLNDGQVIDLGGREIEVVFTPGHTAGSVVLYVPDQSVILGLRKLQDTLRHAAHHEVLPVKHYRRVMQSRRQRGIGGKAFLNLLSQSSFTHSDHKFLHVHRIQGFHIHLTDGKGKFSPVDCNTEETAGYDDMIIGFFLIEVL